MSDWNVLDNLNGLLIICWSGGVAGFTLTPLSEFGLTENLPPPSGEMTVGQMATACNKTYRIVNYHLGRAGIREARRVGYTRLFTVEQFRELQGALPARQPVGA